MTRLSARSGREARDRTTARDFLVWGVAFLVAYAGLDLLPTPGDWICASVTIVLAIMLSWLPRRHQVRTGWTGRARLGWLVVFVCSPAIVATVAPIEPTRWMLLLGALWSLAMALFAVATRDFVLVVAMVLATLSAGVAASQEFLPPLLLFGTVAGGLLILVGARRLYALRQPTPGPATTADGTGVGR